MSQELPHFIIETELGNIEIEVNTQHAPVTAANFLRYVEAGYYNDSKFYRTVTMSNQPDNDVKIEVIQGGLGMDQITGKAKFPPVPLERTTQTGLSHLDGTVSMARLAPDSATSEFFICINDQPELDFGGKRNPDGQGFAAFGRVVRGMDVVRKIQKSSKREQQLTPAIRIVRVTRKPLSPVVSP